MEYFVLAVICLGIGFGLGLLTGMAVRGISLRKAAVWQETERVKITLVGQGILNKGQREVAYIVFEEDQYGHVRAWQETHEERTPVLASYWMAQMNYHKRDRNAHDGS